LPKAREGEVLFLFKERERRLNLIINIYNIKYLFILNTNKEKE
jgi:hypothetical protein